MSASKELSIQMTEYTVNATFKIRGKYLVTFENELKDRVHLLDYQVLPNTEKLYESDKTFQRLVKEEKKAKKAKQDYINKNNK